MLKVTGAKLTIEVGSKSQTSYRWPMLQALVSKRIFFENFSPFEELHYYPGKILFGHEFLFFNYKFPLVSYKSSLYSSGLLWVMVTIRLDRLLFPDQR